MLNTLIPVTVYLADYPPVAFQDNGKNRWTYTQTHKENWQ